MIPISSESTEQPVAPRVITTTLLFSGILIFNPCAVQAQTGLSAESASTTVNTSSSSAENIQTLSPVIATGELTDPARTEGTGSYATEAMTLGKRTQSLKETPQSVSVITRERINEQNMISLGDVMANTTGITVQDTNNYERAYYARGYKIENIQYDGVPTQSGSGFFTQPDMAIYDRVEVLRGPAGLFNGAGEPGGTVNLVRKRPLADFALSGRANVGSWSNYRGEFDLTSRLNESGTVRGRLVGAYQDNDFFYDVANTKRTVGYGIIEFDLTPETTWGVGFSYERNKMTPFYGGVPRYSDGGDLGLSRDTYLNAAWSHVNFERNTLFTDLTHRFNEDWRFRVGYTHTQEKSHDYSGSVFGTVNRATGMGPTLSAFDAINDSKQNALDASLEGAFSAFGKRHDFILGANYWERSYDATSQLMAVDHPNIDVFNFDPRDYSDFPSNPARAQTHKNTRTEQTGIYGSLRLTLLDPLKLIVGGRYSKYRQSVYDRVTSQTTSRSKDNGEFTPYGALVLELSPEWATYASYAEIFRSQATSFKADGSPLDPATGKNYEVGIKGSLYGGQLNTSLAVFRTIEDGRSQADPNFPQPCAGSPTGGACYVNGGKVRSQGFELELSGALTPNWNLAAGYTFNTTKYLRDRTASGEASANERQPYSTFTPKHMFRLWTNYRLTGKMNGVEVGGGVRIQSRTYKTAGALELNQGSYALWDARVAYRINKKLSVALNVNNIFDKKYYRTLGSERGSNWYGEPRSAMLSVQAQF